jgi:hypothetical protein
MFVPALIATVKAQDWPGDDPFAEGPAVPAKAAKPEAAPPDGPFDDDLFSGEAPQGLRPFAKPAAARPAAAQSKPAAPTKPAVKKQQPAAKAARPFRSGEKAILKALEEKTKLEFVDTPLQDAIDYLQDVYRITIKLDTNALKEAGVDASTPVNLTIRDVPLRSALRIMLSDLQLEWTIWSDVLWITTPAKAESDEFMVTKIYDVTDLLVATQDKPYGGNGLPTVDTSGPSATVMGGGWGSAPIVSGMGGGMGGMGGGMGGMGAGTATTGMGGGMFCVPSEAKVPAASSSPGSAALRNVGVSPAMSAMPNYGNGMNVLTESITNTVATKTWQENGGVGTISPHGNLLCITQSFQVQCQVKAFLADLRAKRRAVPTVVVDLQWLWLDGGQYEQLLGAKPSSGARTQLAVDAKALDQLGRKAPGFRGQITCANGQLVHLASGDRRSVIVNTIPIATGGTDAPIGYGPVVQVPNAGVVIELRPTVVPGGKTATLDVQSIVTRWGKPQTTAHVGAAVPPGKTVKSTAAKKLAVGGPAGLSSCPVQLPNMPAQQLATTVRVPLGKPVVLGGMTFAAAESAGMEQATENPLQLYLIATTHIGK